MPAPAPVGGQSCPWTPARHRPVKEASSGLWLSPTGLKPPRWGEAGEAGPTQPAALSLTSRTAPRNSAPHQRSVGAEAHALTSHDIHTRQFAPQVSGCDFQPGLGRAATRPPTVPGERAWLPWQRKDTRVGPRRGEPRQARPRARPPVCPVAGMLRAPQTLRGEGPLGTHLRVVTHTPVWESRVRAPHSLRRHSHCRCPSASGARSVGHSERRGATAHAQVSTSVPQLSPADPPPGPAPATREYDAFLLTVGPSSKAVTATRDCLASCWET